MSSENEALRLADLWEKHSHGYARTPEARTAAMLRRQHAEIASLKEELETERVRLAACGVVAMANTPETAAKWREMRPEYRSASCDDVAKAVDREMALRAEREALRAENEHLRKTAHEHVSRALYDAHTAELRAEADALRADAERWRYVRRNPWRAIDILNDKCSTRPAHWQEEADAAIDAVREGK